MKVTIRNIFWIIAIILFIKCEEDEVTSRNYPRLKTLNVSEITSEGAKFNAEITYRGDFEILGYGFVWGESENPTLENSDRVIYSENIQSQSFSVSIETTLEEEATYFVRAFVQTNDFTVYGENVDFTSLGSKAPIITGITPLRGTLGDTITVTGNNFSYLNINNKLSFNGVISRTITSTDSTLVAIVPDSLRQTNSNISVEIAGNVSSFLEPFELLSPIIESLSINEGKTLDTLIIRGQYFGNKKSHPTVLFGNKKADIIDFNIDSLKVIVPGGIENQGIKVTVAHLFDQKSFNYLKPAIIDFEPKIATWGDTIKVIVENFYEDDKLQRLFLNDIEYQFISTYQDSLFFVIQNNVLTNDGSGPNSKAIVKLEIADFELSFRTTLNFKNPKILNVFPQTVDFGSEITLEVENYHPESNRVTLVYQENTGLKFLEVELTTSSRNLIQFRLPSLELRNRENSDNQIKIISRVLNMSTSSSATVLVRSPIIDSFNPTEVSDQGDIITIKGKNFGSDPIVKFGRDELIVKKVTETEIVAEIPENVFLDPVISEYLENIISVTSNQRSAWSTEKLVINHVTRWEKVNDGNLFEIEGGFLNRRTAYQTLGGKSFGYLLGGRGKMVECCIIPFGLEKLKDVYRYDPRNNSWLRLQNWPQEDDQEELQEVFAFDNKVYAITDNNRLLNSGNLPIALKSSSWNEISDLRSGASYNYFFEIDSQPYILYSPNSSINSWISNLDLGNGTQTDLIELPFKFSNLDDLYVFNGKLRYIRWIEKQEYEFDPRSNNFSLIGSADNSFRIIEYQDEFYSFTNNAIYTFDPVTRTHSELDSVPKNDIGFLFSIGGKLYFYTSNSIMVSFE